MREKSTTSTSPSARLVKNIRRATRKHYSAEEKIRIVLDGLRGESSIAGAMPPRGPPASGSPSRKSKKAGMSGKGGTARPRRSSAR
jgi:hypothetical protein